MNKKQWLSFINKWRYFFRYILGESLDSLTVGSRVFHKENGLLVITDRLGCTVPINMPQYFYQISEAGFLTRDWLVDLDVAIARYV